MLQLKLNKKDKQNAELAESIPTIVDPNVNVEPETSTVIKGRHYVNLTRVITDNAPSVLEYIDNEISILTKKISLLEAERSCVVRLLAVAEESTQ
jgi:hypothetical protein